MARRGSSKSSRSSSGLSQIPHFATAASDSTRNRKKIEATIDNADELLALDREHDGFVNYLRSHGDYEATIKDLRKHFRFLGETAGFYFLHVVGEDVPEHACPR